MQNVVTATFRKALLKCIPILWTIPSRRAPLQSTCNSLPENVIKPAFTGPASTKKGRGDFSAVNKLSQCLEHLLRNSVESLAIVYLTYSKVRLSRWSLAVP